MKNENFVDFLTVLVFFCKKRAYKSILTYLKLNNLAKFTKLSKFAKVKPEVINEETKYTIPPTNASVKTIFKILPVTFIKMITARIVRIAEIPKSNINHLILLSQNN